MNIKEARNTAKLTQAQLAEKLKIPKRTIQNWELGVSNPPEYVERLVVQEILRLQEANSR